ncbi:c-type cytochrome [Cognatiluteimonas telluris]|uniref:c-type cytochrome n=1 Tax=Cognatiluteimonas telluris TaxID=1104775 RepID=UPI00140E5366|nr:c-type cytochrome [Lysobacter telluris]
MSNRTLSAAMPCGAVLLAWAGIAAAATAPSAIAAQGNGHGAMACQGCHGADGRGQAGSAFPRLAGLDAHYLQAQLDAFASGTRDNPVMQPIAKALDDDERAEIAMYYAQLPTGAGAVPGKAGAGDAPGARLALQGRWSQQVPGCVQCHGPGGVGVGSGFPPLAGQPAAYLSAQLHAWKQGTRRNDPLQLMQHISSALSDADIQAVSAWFAAQPARLPETAR